jgi:hypothetical protein
MAKFSGMLLTDLGANLLTKTGVILFGVLLVACTSEKPRSTPPTVSVEHIRSWAPTCEGFVSKGNCDQGDTIAFAGYLCLAEEQIGCDTAKASFGVDGRGWRNPKHEPLADGNSFSRDMLLGALYYFTATKDVQAEANLRSYVKSTGRLCEDATDNRCEMTPGMWGLWGEVAKYIGNEPTDTMKVNMFVDDKQIYLQSLTSPAGYQRELVAMEIVLRRHISKNSKLLDWASEELYKKEKNNPLYEMLARGKTERFWKLFEEQMPKEEPAQKRNWSIAKEDSALAAKESMGWEWIFLYNVK